MGSLGRGPPRTAFALTDITTPGSGLFRVADRARPRLEATEVVIEHDGVITTYVTPYRLGADDWRVFLALSALAGLDGTRFRSAGGDKTPSLWDRLLASGVAEGKDGLRLRTTAYALLREIGLGDSGQNRIALTHSLERLSTVSQTLRKDNRVVSGARLVSFAHDENSGELTVALSSQVARAILGESKQFVRISLVEVRRLENAAAVLLQALFSSRQRPGQTASYQLDHLVGVVYGPGAAPSNRMRQRRTLVRQALASFSGATSWQIALVEVRNVSGKVAWVVRVHRVSKKELAAWEADAVGWLPRESSDPMEVPPPPDEGSDDD